MENEYRKVVFSLSHLSGFTPDDDEQKELDNLARKRQGLFHGQTEIEENDLKKLLFVVEDEKTGEVFCVNPELVKFIN